MASRVPGGRARVHRRGAHLHVEGVVENQRQIVEARSMFEGKADAAGKANLDMEGIKRVIEEREGRIKTDYPDEQKKAYEVTKEIFGLVREKTGDTPIVIFEACYDTPEFESLCSEMNMVCIHGIRDYLTEKEKEGFNTKTSDLDSHWNELGNKFVSEYLVESLKNMSPLSEKIS